MGHLTTADSRSTSARTISEALHETRERTERLVAHVGDEDLERVHSPLMSPLVWDLGHIAAFEDLWLGHRCGGQPLLRPDLMEVYDAFETPRAHRGTLPFLRCVEARGYLAAVRERTLQLLDERGPGDGLLHELVIRHEQQHGETMLQTLALARLDGYHLNRGQGPTAREPADPSPKVGASQPAPPAVFTGLEFVEVPGGPCTLGAPSDGFAYDNERPRHQIDVPGFKIARTPVTNATYLRFVEGGGYERREWWSDEGWSWKEEYDITRPGGWSAELDAEWHADGLHQLDPHAPVIHVSWFEADAFARAHGARLPTETEWEKTATWDRDTESARSMPWGAEPLRPGRHANLDHVALRPLPPGRHTAGGSPYGCLGMLGDVWEWTSSGFTGYPGFAPHPYREYSEVFFGGDYRVLRGGSWATRARVASPTFRNWDYPQRRQIFSGLRLAQDA